MIKQTLSLEERAIQFRSAFSEEALKLVEQLNNNFTDYILGDIIDPHPDMLDSIKSSELSDTEKQDIKDYVLLENVVNSSEKIVREFLEAYPDNKFNPKYTLDNFLLEWNREHKVFLHGDDQLGDYSPVIMGIFDMLERNRELDAFMYEVFNGSYLEGIPGFQKIGISSAISGNEDLFYGLFLGTLTDESRVKVTEIISGKKLANEAADRFLDVYLNFRSHKRFDLGNFLKRYEVESKKFNLQRKSNTGSYNVLYERLRKKSGDGWENSFYELLDEPRKTRVKTLVSELGSKGIIEEDKIRLFEDLLSEGREDLLQCIDLFADQGSDAEDIFLAMYIGNVPSEDLAALGEAVSGGKESIKKYLGNCRYNFSDSAIQYDWRHNLLKITESVNPAKFKGGEVLSSILINRSIQEYSDKFKQDKPGTIQEIRSEINEANNPVYNNILERTLAHYELRLKVGQVTGFKDKLLVVSSL